MAWQAKCLFEFDASAARQATESVKRALDTEPDLRRYFVAMPFDLPAGDTGSRESAQTRWMGKVAEWKALVAASGREVEFEFVGALALVTALTEPRNAGRARYWYGAEVWTNEWAARRLEEVVAKAGRRYSPRLHIDVEAVQAMQALVEWMSTPTGGDSPWPILESLDSGLGGHRKASWRSSPMCFANASDPWTRRTVRLRVLSRQLKGRTSSPRSRRRLPKLTVRSGKLSGVYA